MELFAVPRERLLRSCWPLPRVTLYFAVVILTVAAVNFCAYYFLYRQLSKHHPADHDFVLPMISVFLVLQLPWLGAVGSYRQTKSLVSGRRSDPLEKIQLVELTRILNVYTAIGILLLSISSMLH
jgi:hypothetical protein